MKLRPEAIDQMLPDGESLLSSNKPTKMRDSPGAVANRDRSRRRGAWVRTLWPLVIHGVFALSIAGSMLFYVDGNHFNFNERRPFVSLKNGSTVQSDIYAPLQSDITTSLSVLLAILRLITACWLGALCWRCAFILMEEIGLKPKQLHRMISYGLPAIPTQRRGGIGLLIWIILAIILPAQFVAPLLTGSITWTPSNHPPKLVTNSTIETFALHAPSYVLRGEWERWPNVRKEIVNAAAGLPLLAWGRDTHNGDLKRVILPAARLAVNSTLANITLPYFSVTELEWIEDPQSTLTLDQLSIARIACPKLNLSSELCPLKIRYRFSLIPAVPWANFSVPPHKAVPERRLMALYASYRNSSHTRRDGVRSTDCESYSSWAHGKLPPNIGTAPDPDFHACWAFAWVTYSAGVGVCNNCRVSSYATVQNDTALALQEDSSTNAALQLMPTVISTMIEMNSTSLAPYWSDLDSYVIGHLTRSYAGAWMALTGSTSSAGYGEHVYTAYSVSPPSSQAQVDVRRVYIWLAFQSLITISGILFVYVQKTSDSPMVVDTTLAAFFLDSSGVHDAAKYDHLRGGIHRKAEYEGGSLKVKID